MSNHRAPSLANWMSLFLSRVLFDSGRAERLARGFWRHTETQSDMKTDAYNGIL